MTKQLHKRITNEQVREILEQYESGSIKGEQGQKMLGISRSVFFNWLKRYRSGPKHFSIEYQRSGSNRGIGVKAEKKIAAELMKEKAILKDPSNPVRTYNYSYIQETLAKKHGVKVSLPTIIDRAKKVGAILESGRRAIMTEKY